MNTDTFIEQYQLSKMYITDDEHKQKKMSNEDYTKLLNRKITA